MICHDGKHAPCDPAPSRFRNDCDPDQFCVIERTQQPVAKDLSGFFLLRGKQQVKLILYTVCKAFSSSEKSSFAYE